MKATRKKDTIQVEMTEEKARDLAIFLKVESRRRRQELSMACWPCINACEDLHTVITALGISDDDTAHR